MKARTFGAVLLVCALVGAAPAAAATTPDTRITSGPSGTVTTWNASFRFDSTVGGSTFQCSLDGSPWATCSSPKTYGPLKNGSHAFAVRATAKGRTDASPATRTWNVAVAPPPAPTISSAPSGTVASSSASIAFSDGASGVTFTCSLDGAAATPCTSPSSLSGLADGAHRFSVTAVDAAGNASGEATATWSVDTTAPPAPAITSGPSGSTASTSASFAFTDAESGVAFACALDGAALASCTSPQAYSSLAVGSHTFTLVARDAVGNTSTVTSVTWTVQQAPTQTNYLANGSFESGTGGWTSWNGTVSATSDGVVGSGAAKVALTAADTGYSIYPTTRPLTSTTSGAPYVASGWVRSDTPGHTICLYVREYDSTGARVSDVRGCVTGTTAWQQFPRVAYTTTTAGQLSVFAQEVDAVAGDSFEIDGMQLTDGGAATGGSSTDPVVVAAGDASCGPGDTDYNGGNGTGTRCMQKATADVIRSVANKSTLLALGDLQYDCGALSDFQAGYGPTWGLFDSIVDPVPGNHEYGDGTSVCTPSNASGYFAYFGSRAGDPAKGYYSFDLGSWHVVALNSDCRAVGGCGAGSPEEQWLKADLAAHPAACTLAYWHIPRFNDGQMGDAPAYDAFWQDLYAAHADLVLNAHDHTYQRFLPQNPAGSLDTANGITELIVGTGGESLMRYMTPTPTLAVSSTTTFGVVRLQLHPNGWDGAFLPIAGQTFTDTFSGTCH